MLWQQKDNGSRMTAMIGVDEAGRGCVLGPLVVAAVRATPEGIEMLKRLSIKDSKQYNTHKERMLAFLSFEDCRGIEIRHSTITAFIVDSHVRSPISNLNKLEQTAAFSCIKSLLRTDDEEIVLDSKQMFTVTADKVLAREDFTGSCIAVDKADRDYLVVAAASVVAKTLRDKAAMEIMGDAFNKGAGYPNEHTEKWLRERIARLGQWNGLKDVCKSWKWLANIGINT